MTCQELHCYLENPQRVEVYMYRESLPAAVSAHLRECQDCARLFEEQKSLGVSLNMVRDAAPQVPGALDAKVLASYRRQMAEPESFGQRGRSWFSNPWLLWGSVGAAVMVVVASSIFLMGRQAPAPITEKTAAPEEMHKAVMVQQRPEVAVKEPTTERRKAGTAVEQARKTPMGVNKSPLPAGFASLMYCDELTCTGALDVIRVELPAGAGQSSGAAASPTMAEVLVGADGIARGIRIVQ